MLKLNILQFFYLIAHQRRLVKPSSIMQPEAILHQVAQQSYKKRKNKKLRFLLLLYNYFADLTHALCLEIVELEVGYKVQKSSLVMFNIWLIFLSLTLHLRPIRLYILQRSKGNSNKIYFMLMEKSFCYHRRMH